MPAGTAPGPTGGPAAGVRAHDVVVFGASGFVGRLVAAHLAEHAPPGVRVALAGRDRGRVEAVRAGLPARGRDWPVLVADSGDPASLAALAASTRVVVTTVGPYDGQGLPLVGACAQAGTDYLDLTGEVLFMRDSIAAFDEVARDSGARIVHAAGFDSEPSDLGVLMLAEAVRGDGAGELGPTVLGVTGAKGGVSGGTVASMWGQMDRMRASADAARAVADPYALSPDRGAEPDRGDDGDDERDGWGARWDDLLGRWVGPFVMAGVNTRVVRRSNALAGYAYGRSLRYREVVALGRTPVWAPAAAALSVGTAGLMLGASVRPLQSLMRRFTPSPGEGPSETARREGWFTVEVHTRTTTGAHYRCDVVGVGDPGYQATSVMLGESALTLLDPVSRSGSVAAGGRGGVLTPATALGLPLVKRLRAQGFTIEVRRLVG
jgi:short subunit dehydrogenase-like uncharacterized protein